MLRGFEGFAFAPFPRDVKKFLFQFIGYSDIKIIEIASHLNLCVEINGAVNANWARRGYLRLLQWRFVYWDTSLMVMAAAEGHAHVIKWLHSQRIRIPDVAFEEATKKGHLEALKMLFSLRNHNNMSNTMWNSAYFAITRNQLPILKWLVENKHLPLTRGNFYAAVSSRSYQVMEYLIQQGFDLGLENFYGIEDELLHRWFEDRGLSIRGKGARTLL
jgi:hypothetical protein